MTDWETHPWVLEGRGRVRFGVAVMGRAAEAEWEARRAFGEAAEGLGFDSVLVPDQPESEAGCWDALGGLAEATRRVRLGALVSSALPRDALAMARRGAAVDRASGGRLVLGLAASWHEGEMRALGVEPPRPYDRLAALRETLAAVRRAWYGEAGEAAGGGRGGRAAEKAGAVVAQRPRVPVLMGGSGDRVLIGRVAELADVCNLDDTPARGAEEAAALVASKLAVLRGHCERLGRPYGSLIKSYSPSAVLLAPTERRVEEKRAALPPLFARAPRANMTTPGRLVARLRPVIEAGVGYVIVGVCGYGDVETLELLAERVVPALEGLGASG